MIVSFSRNYIFLKPFKVGGTSILQALGSTCTDGDWVSAVFLEPKEAEKLATSRLTPLPQHPHPTRSHAVRYQVNTSLNTHALPSTVRDAVGEETWHRFLKISVVRNPWDLMVSFRRMPLMNPDGYRKSHQEDFTQFVSRFRFELLPPPFDQFPVNDGWYFDPDTHLPIPDVFIRFEHLQEDYHQLCDRLGLRPPPLPHLQNKGVRPHYRKFYTPQTRERVAELFSRCIEHFQYRF